VITGAFLAVSSYFLVRAIRKEALSLEVEACLPKIE